MDTRADASGDLGERPREALDDHRDELVEVAAEGRPFPAAVTAHVETPQLDRVPTQAEVCLGVYTKWNGRRGER